jgi:NAD(P)H-hydrate repair Nnr-like enzyme with NAD(P)H-hydrate dehydratase domain
LLTPHDGEYERIAGKPVGDDRLEAARSLARETSATVLLKGRVTVVADPDGLAWLSATGGPALATAGTGDVLTGIAAAFLARGLPPREAGAYAACVHGLAAMSGPQSGLVASDLPELLPAVLA